MFCVQARRHGLSGVKHQWIILGTYDTDWWQVHDDTVDCTPSQLNDTLHGYLATDVLPLSTNGQLTISGKVIVILDLNLDNYNLVSAYFDVILIYDITKWFNVINT